MLKMKRKYKVRVVSRLYREFEIESQTKDEAVNDAILQAEEEFIGDPFKVEFDLDTLEEIK